MLHPEIQGSLDHSSGNVIIEYSICYDCIVSHSRNVASDQVECLEDVVIKDPFEFKKYEDVFSCEHDDGEFYLEKDVIFSTCKEGTNPISFDQFKGDSMKGELDVELGSLTLDVHFDSLVGGIENLNFHQNALLVYVSTESLEIIALNEGVPQHMDTKISLVSDTKINTSDTFQNMYSETLHSLYPDLFTGNDGMLLNDEILRDEGVFRRNSLPSFEFYSMEKLLAYMDKEM